MAQIRAVRIAALVLFATVKDAVEATNHGLLPDVIGEPHARSHICFVPANNVGTDLTAAHCDRRRKQRSGNVTPLITAGALKLGDKGALTLGPAGMYSVKFCRSKLRLPSELLANRRKQFVADS